jgi:hypothetical protein
MRPLESQPSASALPNRFAFFKSFLDRRLGYLPSGQEFFHYITYLEYSKKRLQNNYSAPETFVIKVINSKPI